MSKTRKFIIVHCTATPKGRKVTSGDLYEWAKGRGWKTVGYRDMVHTDGTIENIVKDNGDDIIDPWEITNGASSLNDIASHVCYVGGLDAKGINPEDTRTEAQKLALETYVKDQVKSFPDILIAGHNQFTNKACPCFDTKQWLLSIDVPHKNIYGLDKDDIKKFETFKKLDLIVHEIEKTKSEIKKHIAQGNKAKAIELIASIRDIASNDKELDALQEKASNLIEPYHYTMDMFFDELKPLLLGKASDMLSREKPEMAAGICEVLKETHPDDPEVIEFIDKVAKEVESGEEKRKEAMNKVVEMSVNAAIDAKEKSEKNKKSDKKSE